MTTAVRWAALDIAAVALSDPQRADQLAAELLAGLDADDLPAAFTALLDAAILAAGTAGRAHAADRVDACAARLAEQLCDAAVSGKYAATAAAAPPTPAELQLKAAGPQRRPIQRGRL
jgi:hypothetical protein